MNLELCNCWDTWAWLSHGSATGHKVRLVRVITKEPFKNTSRRGSLGGARNFRTRTVFNAFG